MDYNMCLHQQADGWIHVALRLILNSIIRRDFDKHIGICITYISNQETESNFLWPLCRENEILSLVPRWIYKL